MDEPFHVLATGLRSNYMKTQYYCNLGDLAAHLHQKNLVSITTIALLFPMSAQAIGAFPEPGSLLLAGAALVVLGVFARKRIFKRTRH
jgi:hypothetical protein